MQRRFKTVKKTVAYKGRIYQVRETSLPPRADRGLFVGLLAATTPALLIWVSLFCGVRVAFGL